MVAWRKWPSREACPGLGESCFTLEDIRQSVPVELALEDESTRTTTFGVDRELIDEFRDGELSKLEYAKTVLESWSEV